MYRCLGGGSPGPGAAFFCNANSGFRVPSVLSLFLEATQLKTVPTANVVLRADPSVAEVQVVGTATPRRNRRRPDVPGAAGVIQRTVVSVAVARGRGAPIFFDRAPRGTRRPDYSRNNSRKLRPKTCDSQQTATAGRAGQPPPTGWLRCRSALENWSLLRQLPPCGCPGKLLRPTVIDRAPGRFILFCN